MFGQSLLLGSGARPVVSEFSSGGTWCCCPGIRYIQVIAVGAGGGGGDGIFLNTTTCGDAVHGAAGGGGGGVSYDTFLATSIGPTGSVVVGTGGSRSSSGQAGNGGHSSFSSCSAFVRAGGGKGGYAGQDVPSIYEPFPSGVTNGGSACVGGTGTYSAGNAGGQAYIRNPPAGYCQDGIYTSNLTNTTRGGAGGGSATYPGFGCPALNGAASTAGTCYTVCGVDLSFYGKGGDGGTSRVCAFPSGRTNGTVGGNGLVKIVQYF
jgi:hypothetical protein